MCTVEEVVSDLNFDIYLLQMKRFDLQKLDLFSIDKDNNKRAVIDAT